MPGDVARWSTSVRAASAALPQGPRSGPGSSVPLHPHLSGPIRPTRRHIPISPLGGLYQMPSLCTLRLGDLPVVPSFHCPSFLTCRPLRLRGDRNRLVPVMRFRRRPSPCYEWLGSPDYHRDFYFQASDESVTLLAAGYNYDSHWTVLSVGLSPIGMTASLAAA